MSFPSINRRRYGHDVIPTDQWDILYPAAAGNTSPHLIIRRAPPASVTKIGPKSGRPDGGAALLAILRKLPRLANSFPAVQHGQFPAQLCESETANYNTLNQRRWRKCQPLAR